KDGPQCKKKKANWQTGTEPAGTRFGRSAPAFAGRAYNEAMRSTPAVLLIQLGTPDAPTAAALKTYLRQFLSDPRVIEMPRWRWWFILNFFILPTRPARSAAKYQRIWDKHTGSPLLHITRLQTEALQRLLPDVPVRFGMQIGNPPVAGVIRELVDAGIDRLIVLPMYPQ